LNLDYLKELSGGNKAFEISMVEQFLQKTPGELEAMQEAFGKNDYIKVVQIAHNMKTSVAFMGLLDILNNDLDFIENNARTQEENTNVQTSITIVNNICLQVFIEAKQYLDRLTR
jgi:cytochrome b involved in lipid metabolism